MKRILNLFKNTSVRLKTLVTEWPSGNIHTAASREEEVRKYLRENANDRHILFLVGGTNAINGGWISIFSIARETRRLSDIHQANVAVCTGFGEIPLRRYTKFDNETLLLPLWQVLENIKPGSEVLIHVPEGYIGKFLIKNMSRLRRDDLRWSFNILLQNIDQIPSRESIARLQELGEVTATVAHAAYANADTADRLGCPVHMLSTWVCPEEFDRVPFHNKDRLIIVSPDIHPKKSLILMKIAEALPDHQIVEIRRMTYGQYRSLIRRAKFTFTFGEGLDGYFVESIFSGAIGLAIFNNRFFTDDYAHLDGIFPDAQSALQSVREFLTLANEPVRFGEIADAQFKKLAEKYVRSEYLDNLKAFYAAYFSPRGKVVESTSTDEYDGEACGAN
jgi:hypothetical protein